MNILHFWVLLFSITVCAQEKKEQKKDSLQTLKIVLPNTYQYEYKKEISNAVSKMHLTTNDNPQIYNVVATESIEKPRMKNFNDALKNTTRINCLRESTVRGRDGENFSLPCFAVQATMINGLPEINNSILSLADIVPIEVFKEPLAPLFGSNLISCGNIINLVIQKADSSFANEISCYSGSFDIYRFKADVSISLNSNLSGKTNTLC